MNGVGAGAGLATLIPVVLSGGAGTRLWPVSREAHPKPFIKLPDGESLLLKTVKRALATGANRVLTITNRDYYFITRDEYSSLEMTRSVELDFLLEPVGRNTAPAIAAAAFWIQERFGERAIMLVLPADHLIRGAEKFLLAVSAAKTLAEAGHLVTFGIRPTFPETGFGYIEAGDSLDPYAYRVRRFIEKPVHEKAEEFVASGRYYWNSGMFCFQVGAFLEELRRSAPQVFDSMQTCWQATVQTQTPLVLNPASFAQIPDISVDYAVMEKARRVALVPGEFDWCDIGSWKALSALESADSANNRISGDAIVIDSLGCYIRSEDRIVAVVGVENLLVVDTPDALLIAHRDQAQKVKAVVQRLSERGHESARVHRTVHRPWGTYTVLEEGPRYKIKRIVVKPGASLSLQYHLRRSEHWVVVSGTAQIVNGETEFTISTDESSYIPAGNPHRLVNTGSVECVMIEVQSGDYLGEDDIVRLKDRYGRVAGSRKQ